MRVLHVIESCGGSLRHVIDLASCQKFQGHEVGIIYSPVRAEQRYLDFLENSDGIDTWSVPMDRALNFKDILNYLAIARIVRSFRPNVVHAHSSKAGLLTRMLPIPSLKAKRIYTPHAFITLDPDLSPVLRKIYGIAEWALSVSCQAIIAVSTEEKKEAEALGLSVKKVFHVPNGIHRPDVSERSVSRKQLELKEKDFLFGFLGRFANQKAPERLVTAFIEVAKINENAHLAMAGYGDQLEQLKQLATTSPNSDRIHFVDGSKGNNIMSAFDVFVLCSRFEGMPYVVIEAASLGLPIISTDVAGVIGLVRNGENGIVVKNSDESQYLVSAMLDTLDPIQYHQLSEEASARKGTFSVENMTELIMDVYASC